MTLTELALSNPFTFLSIVVILSLLILIKSADYLVMGVTNWARKLGLSDYLVGLIVVALTASLPEFVSSLMGSSQGDDGIVLGTIIGSNVAGLTIIPAVMAIMSKKLNIKSKLFEGAKIFVFILVLVPSIMLMNGVLSRVEGAILILGYIIYVIFLWKKEGELGSIKKSVRFKDIWYSGLLFMLALAALILASKWLIFGSIEMAQRLNISSYLIATIVIGGIGAQLPDLITIIRSRAQGHEDVGMGDILGSTIVKVLLFLGILAVIRPITVNISMILLSVTLMVLTTGYILLLMRKGYMVRRDGWILVLVYLGFLIAEIFF